MDHSSSGSYVLISPVRDEEKYIEKTVLSVLGQSVRPLQWVIVDDASRDRTPEILRKYEQQFPWIRVMRLEHGSERQPGAPVISAFNAGFDIVADSKFDFVVKFDCDLCIPPDYFEQLLERFRADKALGIASGVYLERADETWQPVKMPAYHAAGAAKMIRAECFRQIGGFVCSRGWDTVDEIKAQFKGWKTTHFKDLKFYHLKNEGTGIGASRTSQMHGEIYYLTGGPKLFFLFKVLHRCLSGRPRFASGFSMLKGYAQAWMGKKQLLVSEDEASLYRTLLNQRIWEGLSRAFGSNSSKMKGPAAL